MPGRSYSSDSYRFGFNGKENDNEVKGTGNQQDYGMRIYDPRIVKFLSVDPLTAEYPWYTPYQFAGNSPILNIDLDGLEPWNVNGQGTTTTSNGDNSISAFSYSYSGTVHGPYRDQSAATQAASNPGTTIYDLSFVTKSASATRSGFNGSTTNVITNITSGYFPSYTMGGSLFSSGGELGNGGGYYNSSTTFNSFWNGGSTGSGACYPTDVGGTLTDLCIRQPIQYGLEQVGMGENAAYWTSSGLTLAGMLTIGGVKLNAAKGGGLGSSFKNATLKQIDDAFQVHVQSGKLQLKWVNPKTGAKAYQNTKSGYSYNLDPGGTYRKKLELPILM